MNRQGRPQLAVIIAMIMLVSYLSVALGAELTHNHEHDGYFHDDCPACQWNIQHQSDSPEDAGVINFIANPLQLTQYNIVESSSTLPDKVLVNLCSSRAPPETDI
ncbi:MAG: hypothetical protein KAV42_09815 [Candidatus Krumholzibacteria bacterium]|nr:hypothetical protein [Candidatus Krumholzibacteria bacterium]